MYPIATAWWLPGAALILFGLAIVIFPELLSLLVALALIFGGVNLLIWGSWMRRAQTQRVHIHQFNQRQWF